MLYHITKNGFRIIPISADNLEYTRVKQFSRSMYLSIAAILVAAVGTVAGKLFTMIIQWLTAWVYFGDVKKDVNGAENDELGIWIILIPIAGAVLLTWLSRHRSAFLKAIGLTAAIAAGAPLGVESPAMIFNGALGNQAGKLFRCTPEESYVLFVAGACSTLGSLFGAPVAAMFLAMEVFFAAVTFYTMLPVILAAVTAGAGSYLLRGTTPVFNIPTAPTTNKQALIAYLAVGLFVGLWGSMSAKLSSRIEKMFGKLTIRNQWYLLFAALIVGIAGYISPRVLGTGNHYVNDLLQAHVTLSILFSLAILKLVAWLFFSGAYKTGSGITPLLITGGAAGLLVGVVIQLVFPAVVIHSGTLVLAGMGAMLAGSSRAVLTAAILSIELTHDINTALPVLGACCIAYCMALLTSYSRKEVQRG
jgi:H+/Cl- antiporter ClcA